MEQAQQTICGHCENFRSDGKCIPTGRDVGYFDTCTRRPAKNTAAPQSNTQGMKICRSCKRELPLGEFGLHSRTKDGHKCVCTRCWSQMIQRSHLARQQRQTATAP